MDADPSILQWLYITFVAPVFGWIGGWFHSWNRQRRKTKNIIALLSGLPPEAKSILIDFNHQGTHTLRGDPGAPVIRLLIHQGILSVGPGGGTYDAVDRYLTVRPEILEAMKAWIKTDLSLTPIVDEFLEKIKHDSSPST